MVTIVVLMMATMTIDDLHSANRRLSNYSSISANNKPKSRLRAKFSYICCIFSHEASTSDYRSLELKRNSKVVQ